MSSYFSVGMIAAILVLGTTPITLLPTYAASIDFPGGSPVIRALINTQGQVVGNYKDATGFSGSLAPSSTGIAITASPPEIDLRYRAHNPSGGLDHVSLLTPPQSTLTVTVTNPDGTPAKGVQVQIKTCTLPSTGSGDGHQNHVTPPKIVDGCDTGRPAASLRQNNNKLSDPATLKTNDQGEITLTYESPSVEVSGKEYFIAGRDTITATLVSDSTVRAEIKIDTKVPNLHQLVGSASCPGGTSSYRITCQDNHGSLFFGTSATNNAVMSIASIYMQRQIDCSNNASSQSCVLQDGTVVSISGRPTPIHITAMSLPWGGVSDIAGNWRPPHFTHNDGLEVDIGFGSLIKNGGNLVGNRCGSTQRVSYDGDRILLLRDTIMGNANFDGFPSGEGGDLAKTMSTGCPHIHIYFKDRLAGAATSGLGVAGLGGGMSGALSAVKATLLKLRDVIQARSYAVLLETRLAFLVSNEGFSRKSEGCSIGGLTSSPSWARESISGIRENRSGKAET